jgi:hypothetical protein
MTLIVADLQLLARRGAPKGAPACRLEEAGKPPRLGVDRCKRLIAGFGIERSNDDPKIETEMSPQGPPRL